MINMFVKNDGIGANISQYTIKTYGCLGDEAD
jgi:hypothetical protein